MFFLIIQRTLHLRNTNEKKNLNKNRIDGLVSHHMSEYRKDMWKSFKQFLYKMVKWYVN